VAFHPKALLVSAVFIVLLWLAVSQGFLLIGLVLDVALSWGFARLIPDDWPGGSSATR
jgi:hypothetical protein